MDKKFVETVELSEYEILTDDGFKDVIALHKTIPYKVYKLILKNKELKCADFHKVFRENCEEVFVKKLKHGDKIQTIDGIEEVLSVEIYNYEDNMWDFELSGNNVKYYTNGILSHNTYLISKLISELSEKKTFIYVPTYMMHSIADPEFISFIGGFKDAILLLEDAENILTQSAENRSQAVANILNMTDGLLNDYLNIQIISTFNVSSKMIDSALTRAGRLIVNYKFGKLTIKQSNKLAEKIGIKERFNEPKTLAEIYEGANQLIYDDLNIQSPVGFKIGN